MDVGFDINQSFYDSMFVLGVATLPFFILDVTVNDNMKDYTNEVIFIGSF